MYGLIVPPGVSPEVAEALEGDHHNPDIDEMQTRMYLREYIGGSEYALPQKVEYVSTGERTRWMALGEKHGRQ